jgi:hypothetical protein
VLLLLAIICFIAAVVVHAAAFTSNITWLDWQGLMLLGLLLWCASGYGPALPARWRPRNRD